MAATCSILEDRETLATHVSSFLRLLTPWPVEVAKAIENDPKLAESGGSIQKNLFTTVQRLPIAEAIYPKYPKYYGLDLP